MLDHHHHRPPRRRLGHLHGRQEHRQHGVRDALLPPDRRKHHRVRVTLDHRLFSVTVPVSASLWSCTITCLTSQMNVTVRLSVTGLIT